MTTPYAQPRDLRQYLDAIPVTPEVDDTLAVILERTTAMLITMMGFAFSGYTTGTKGVRGNGTQYLPLPPHKADSVTGVVYGADNTAVDAEDWEVTEGRKYLYAPNGYWARNVRYTITADWGDSTVPADIVQVTLEVAVNVWRAKDAGNFSDIVGVEGAGGVGYERFLTDRQRVLIDTHKNKRAPAPFVV